MSQLKHDKNEVEAKASLSASSIKDFLRGQKALKKYFEPTLSEEQDSLPPSPPNESSLEGPLEEISKRLQSEPSICLILAARSIFIQMGCLLYQLNRHGCGFRQLELKTFLMHKGRLYIDDTDSLIAYASMNSSAAEQKSERLVEDNRHADDFGRALYHFIVGPFLLEPFDEALFHTSEGQVFQTIIRALTEARAEDRMSIKEAVAQFKKMDPSLIQLKECAFSLMDTIRQLPVEKAPEQANLCAYQQRINTANLSQIKVICNELETLEKEERELYLLKIESHNLLEKILEREKSLALNADSSKEPKFSVKDHERIKSAPLETIRLLLERLKQHNLELSPATSFKKSQMASFCSTQRSMARYGFHAGKKLPFSKELEMKATEQSSELRAKARSKRQINRVTIHTRELKVENNLGIECDFGRLLNISDTNNSLTKKSRASNQEQPEDVEMTKNIF